MPSIASQLETLAGIKSDIKAAIIDKGQTVGDDFSTYATAIGNIEGGGGGGTTVIKQGAVSAGAFAFYNPNNYGEDEDTTEIVDSLFSKLDASALHEDFDGNVVSVSQALAAAIGFSYNSTDNIIYYSFGENNANQYGFRIIQDSDDSIYIEIVYNNTDTYSKGYIHFSLGSKYIIYNSDQAGSVILSRADTDGVPTLENCLFASPYTYTYNDQITVEKAEGYVLPDYSTGYTSLTLGYFDYKLDGNPAYPGYPTQVSYGVDPIICLTPYGYTNEDTNPVGVYFTNVYLITRMGYHSGCYIINLEGTYYLMLVSSDGNCGGIAFRLAETTSNNRDSSSSDRRSIPADTSPNLIDIEITQNGYKYPTDYNPQPDGFRSVYVNVSAPILPEVTLYIRHNSASYTPGRFEVNQSFPAFSGDSLPDDWDMGIPLSQIPEDGDFRISEVIVL